MSVPICAAAFDSRFGVLNLCISQSCACTLKGIPNFSVSNAFPPVSYGRTASCRFLVIASSGSLRLKTGVHRSISGSSRPILSVALYVYLNC
jgi:hypothetical protein